MMIVVWTDRDPDGLAALQRPLASGRVAADRRLVVAASHERRTDQQLRTRAADHWKRPTSSTDVYVTPRQTVVL